MLRKIAVFTLVPFVVLVLGILQLSTWISIACFWFIRNWGGLSVDSSKPNEVINEKKEQ